MSDPPQEQNRPHGEVVRAEVNRGHKQGEIYLATAYTWTGNRTSTGTWPQEGRTVAVDPKIIPYGTRLIINGRPGYVAEDCGGLVKGRRIDIYMNNREECVRWGVQKVVIEIQG